MGEAQQANKYQETITKRGTRPASKQEPSEDQDQDQALADRRRQWAELDFAKK